MSSAAGDRRNTVHNRNDELARSGVPIAEFALGQPSLDEVFLALTGHPADGPEDDETVDQNDEDEEDAA